MDSEIKLLKAAVVQMRDDINRTLNAMLVRLEAVDTQNNEASDPVYDWDAEVDSWFQN